MSSNLVIVAIPDENDRVWKISSEKIPHLTVLFLGEADNVANLDQIMLFIEHAASTMLKRFYLPVDRRGELGADQADVLFFKKNRYDFKAIRDFRSLLLKDPNIKTAYDSTKQFETPEAVGAPGQAWIPHLTLGYPTTPAKKIPDEEFGGGLYSVEFNKIAVWTGDFEGPDFLLKDYGEEFDEMAIPMDVAMSDLQHVGVKGMKWGVRKEEFLTRRADKKFEKKAKSGGTMIEIFNQGSKLYREQDLDRINAKPEYVNANFAPAHKVGKHQRPAGKDHGTSLEKKYLDEHYDTLNKRINEVANAQTNRSGTRQYEWKNYPDAKWYGVKRNLVAKDVEHADAETITVELVRDEKGKITNVKLSSDALVQGEELVPTADIGAEFVLKHFGVKGMRWGVRNERSVATDIHTDTGIVRRRTKVRTKGGEAQPAHEDAVKAAVQKQKLKKSGTDALSNNELKDLASRLELEVRVETLATKKGRKFISRQLETQGQQQLQKGIGRGVSTGAARVVKKGGKAAGAAALLA